MRELPIFVPFEGEHIAAVVTLPDYPPRGLALLMQGLGAPRSHRYRLWTRTARILADRGIASVRMDYPELGDSTGKLRPHVDDVPVGEALAVGRVAMAATGVDRVAVVGNCLGARAAVALAATRRECVSICCVLPGSPKTILQDAGRTAPHRAARRMGKRVPRLARSFRGLVTTRSLKPRIRFLPEVMAATQSCSVMLLYIGGTEGHLRLKKAVEALAVPERPGIRTEVQFIRAGNTSALRLPLDIQPVVIERIADWIELTLPVAPGVAAERGRSVGPRVRAPVAADMNDPTRPR